MGYIVVATFVLGLLLLGWKMTSRNAYESADYTVLESDGPIELRDYPDLMIASTKMSGSIQGDDGSFGRLFQYITGANEDRQKIAMTTPVFMEPETDQTRGQMGFVIPHDVADAKAPLPSSEQIELIKRSGGKFAAIRFAGRADLESRRTQEAKLIDWIEAQGLDIEGDVEVASYDPPWTPGPLRRNEILIRIAE